MEPPRVDDVLARAVDEQVNEQRALRSTLQSVERRIGELEARMRRIEERLETAGATIEGASSELVSFVRQELAQLVPALAHQRKAVVAEVKAAVAEVLLRAESEQPAGTAESDDMWILPPHPGSGPASGPTDH